MKLLFALIHLWSTFDLSWGMSFEKKEFLKQTVVEMFYHAYDNYMKHAFPMDELDPIKCAAKSRDYKDSSNFGVNDVLGDYCLTLIDSLDMLLVIEDFAEFKRAVGLVEKFVQFRPNTVQVFESNIRILGGLLSSHLMAKYVYHKELSDFHYEDSLLKLAIDLGDRLMFAFNFSETGLPHPRVNLHQGVPAKETTLTCTAGAGSLLLEFGILSRLTNDSRYETAALKALDYLWSRRSNLNLVGNSIDVETGQWTEMDSGVGAGIDSFFEYMLKSYIVFGDEKYLKYFEDAYGAIMKYMLDDHGFYYRRVHMTTGYPCTPWVDSLGAFFPGLQVLYGDIPSAIKSWEFYYALWKKYNALPERWNYKDRNVLLSHYPLRPELIESTYMLYQATKNDYYLEAGETFIRDLQQFSRKPCGFASIRNVETKSHDDRMESFFLSETLKYLYLLFADDHRLNTMDSSLIFTTEAHPVLLPRKLRSKIQRASDRVCESPRHLNFGGQSPLSVEEKVQLAKIINIRVDMNDSGSCLSPQPALPLTPQIYEFNTMDMFFPNGGNNYKEARIERIDGGFYLIDDGKNLKLNMISTNSGSMRVSEVNGIKIPPGSKIVVKQSGFKVEASSANSVKVSHNNEIFVVRVFKELGESLINVNHTNLYNNQSEVIEDYVATPALFGTSVSAGLESKTSDGSYLTYPIEGLFVYDERYKHGCVSFDPYTCKLMSGNIALVQRGHCLFAEKASKAVRCNAKAIIVMNNAPEMIQMSTDERFTDNSIDLIVAGILSQTDSARLLNLIASSPGQIVEGALFPISWSDNSKALLTSSILGSRALMALADKQVENFLVVSDGEFNSLAQASKGHSNLVKRILMPGMSWRCLMSCPHWKRATYLVVSVANYRRPGFYKQSLAF